MRGFKRWLSDLLIGAGVLLVFVLTINGVAPAGSISPSAYGLIQNGGSALTRFTTLNFTGAGVVCADDSTRTTCTVSGAATPFYQTVSNAGSALTQRSTINCDGTGLVCVDNSGAGRTDFSVQAYQTVQDEGSALTQRRTINFIGAGVTCADNSGSTRTDCTIPAGGATANQNIRPISGGFNGGGVALTVGTVSYTRVPYACTISAYNILVDTGTISFDVWKIGTGSAIPTVANTIISGASYLSISSGTATRSTSTAAFTTTAVTANDIVAIQVQAVSGATIAQLVIQCDAS